MKSFVHKKVFSLTLLCYALLCAHASALSLAPGLFMVQNVTPGTPVDVRKKSGVAFVVSNDGDKDAAFLLQCEKPSLHLADWERGYDELPDPTWFKLEKEEVVVPAKSKAEVGLVIDVPDKPEYYNCKWVATVLLTGGTKKARVGVGLGIAARVQVETMTSDDPKTGGAVAISAIPSVMIVDGKPGDAFERKVLIGNNTQRDLDCVPQRLVQVYPTEEFKYARYTSPRQTALIKESWLKSTDEKFSLKPGEKHEYKFAGQIPATAKAGEKYEELVFITAPAPEPGAKTAAGRETRTFFRVRYEIAGEEKK